MKKNKCSTRYCRNKRAPGRRKCYRCKQRSYRERDRVKTYYYDLKGNARRRGYEFTITLSYLRIVLGDYADAIGRRAGCLSLDRINPLLGYVPGNVQILELGDNVRKSFIEYGRNFKRVTYY